MSVTLAPRARISEKAAWPGVSMKVMGLPWAVLTCRCVGLGLWVVLGQLGWRVRWFGLGLGG